MNPSTEPVGIDPDSGTARRRTGAVADRSASSLLAESRKSRLRALASLLADESPAVLANVRLAFEALGEKARPTLERAARCEDARLRARARAILLAGAKREALHRFARYAVRDELDLERALLLLARFHSPGLDFRPYGRALDAMAAEVARRAAVHRSAGPNGELDRALLVSEYLGKDLGFGGSRGSFHHPDNIHLHRAIERRAGMPLTLSAIWVFVARRAGIRASFLPLPGHVMVRIHAGRHSAIVDPYHQGRKRTEGECRRYLEKHGIAIGPASFLEAPESSLLRRQVGNLARSAELRGFRDESRALNGLLAALAPHRTGGSLPG